LNPAKFLGLGQSLGTVEKGKVADLVLLDANPLDEIKNTRKISAVVVGGRYLSKERLEELLRNEERR
jgi:imidazolonepropionase-like amidohydrolase